MNKGKENVYEFVLQNLKNHSPQLNSRQVYSMIHASELLVLHSYCRSPALLDGFRWNLVLATYINFVRK
jgi:hypothetical protein